MQDSDRRQILKNMQDFYLIDICTSDLCPFSKFSNLRPILKSMIVSHFLKLTSNDVCSNTNQ